MKELSDWLRSEETGDDFRHCVKCQLPLLELDRGWLVNKEYVGGECVVEYAVCTECRDEVAREFSEESAVAVKHFLETEIDWQEWVRETAMMQDPADRLERCVACRCGRDSVPGFGISALMDSGGMPVLGPLPLMLCRGCMDRMASRLSERSRAVWSGFLHKYLQQPPDVGGLAGLW